MNKTLKQSVLDIASREMGPFYFYDRSVIRENCRSFSSIPYENKLITFASMANASRPFLRTVLEEGFSIFVNSHGHLDIALELGFPGKDIVFTSSGMDEESMTRVAKMGAILNLDSLGQVKVWRSLFPGKPVGIRCNIGDRVEAKKTRGGYFLGRSSRLGLNLEEIEALDDKSSINGLHLYLGTDIIDLEYFQVCYSIVADLASMFPNLEYLDFGGGFGVTTEAGQQFDMDAYGAAVTRIMEEVSKNHGRSIRLILEPGRIIGGESAWFVTRVTDVKQRPEMQFVGVNASTAQFTRPLMYPDDAYHPVTLLSDDRGGSKLLSSIYGCSTYSRDFFSKDLELPPMQKGDLIAFGHAGSYCSSSYTTFLGFAPAVEHYQ
ncbi:hypothetical protein KKF84_16530 [Myxococcota bacterium]|nr:hypothetical protein [Myxococcota bacterium]MBU1536932.1 hypothetical protein [Myxococcota bacterium]